MKRPRRESGGGEIALMAVITKAMGAFLVLVVIMLPHYSYVLVQNKTAEAAQNQIDRASEKIDAIADKLKKGRLTDEEIDDLLRQIETLKKQLAELKTLVASLKNELDQARAEIARLTDAKTALEAEVADLKAQLEQLKTYEPPATTAVVSWSGCPGAIFDVYVWSDATGPDGRTQPLADRTAQPTFWNSEKKGGLVFRPSREAGHVYWRTPEFNRDERIYIWVKLLNPINPSYPGEVKTVSARRECPVNVTLETTGGKNRRSMVTEGQYPAGDTSPIVLTLAVLKRSDGTLEPFNASPEERAKLLADVAAAKCEGLLCSFKGGGAKNETAPQTKPRFLEFATSNYEIGNNTAGLLFDLAAVKNEIGTGELFRWLALFPQKGALPQAIKLDASQAGAMEFLETRLRDKGAPGAVRAEVIGLIDGGKQPVQDVLFALEKLPDRRAALDAAGREMDDDLDQDSQRTMTPEEREQKRRISLFQKAIRIADKAFEEKRLPTNGWSINLLQASEKPRSPEISKPSEKDVIQRLATAGLPDDLSNAIKMLLLEGYYSLEDFDANLSEDGGTVGRGNFDPVNRPHPK